MSAETGAGRIGAVVLAAGAATRFGAPKQRLFLPGILHALAESPVDDVVVVSGAYPLEAEGARVVRAADWGRGPGASLRVGLADLGDDVEAAVVVLADGPKLSPAAVARVVAAFRDGSSAAVLSATYDGERSHPVLIPRALWATVPDEGARALEVALVDCRDIDPPGDVDHADDIREAAPPSADI
ncbi:MAG TPA: NTP transferase domain-containing protein [Gaiellaceae bacterium]